MFITLKIRYAKGMPTGVSIATSRNNGISKLQLEISKLYKGFPLTVPKYYGKFDAKKLYLAHSTSSKCNSRRKM